MNDLVKKFSRLDGDHQIRFLYKKLRAEELSSEELSLYLASCQDSLFQNYSSKTLDERNVEELLSRMEQFLNRGVTDSDILVNEGDGRTQKSSAPLKVILHNLRSAFNVGSIFRSAECLGAEHIYLSGYTPTPEAAPVQKTTMGTEEHISWSSTDLEEVLSGSVPVVALETVEGASSLFDYEFPKECVLLMGNERFGIDKEILEKVDSIVSIPVFGWKNSLNVSNAFALAGYEYRRQWERR